MGEWYLKDECKNTAPKNVKGGASVDNCCSVDPIVTCHYRDKPSKIPCKDSPPIDNNGLSFW